METRRDTNGRMFSQFCDRMYAHIHKLHNEPTEKPPERQTLLNVDRIVVCITVMLRCNHRGGYLELCLH